MKFDLHTHHERCGHAEGPIERYIEAAIAKGLGVIGISDHSPYFADERDHPEPGIAMAKSEFPNYVEEVLRLKERYADRIEVLLGVESDFYLEHAEVYRNVYKQYPFDYIIGSIHQVDGRSIFNRRRWDGLTEAQKVTVKERYYEQIAHSVRSRMFDILGHIDAMKGYYPAFSEIRTQAVDDTLKLIGEYDVAIEINTSGKTKDVGGWYPADEMLERAHHYGVMVTFGSDAHVPDRVADDWELVRAKLKEIGFKQWCYFRRRQRVLVDL